MQHLLLWTIVLHIKSQENVWPEQILQWWEKREPWDLDQLLGESPTVVFRQLSKQSKPQQLDLVVKSPPFFLPFISLTFYTSVFCTKVLFSSYVLAKKALLYKKRELKMLMKLTLGIFKLIKQLVWFEVDAAI